MFVRVHDSAPAEIGRTRARASAQRSYEVHDTPSGTVHLRLWGSLPLGWAGSLTRGLADAGLSVRRAVARRGAGTAWIAAFEIERTSECADPMLVDYLALTTAAAAARDVDLHVTRHRVEPDASGCVHIEVEAPDQPGFLAGLLERLRFLRLEPIALEIDTGPDGARDRISVRPCEGDRVSPGTLRVLDEVLAGTLLCAPKGEPPEETGGSGSNRSTSAML